LALQALIDAEAAEKIGADPWERTVARVTYCNGTRPKVLSTKAGDLTLSIPKLHKGSFFPGLLEPRRRIDQALYAVVMEAYVNGVSTRSVDDRVVAMGVDTGISKSEVSRICTGLDERVEAFRNRTLGHIASAERAAETARRRCRDRLAGVPVGLRERIATELRQGRSPEAIWADLRVESTPALPCVETIYQAVYGGALGVKATECLRTRRPRRRSRQARHPNKRGVGLPNISARPAGINDRLEVGHWDIEQIIGARNQSSDHLRRARHPLHVRDHDAHRLRRARDPRRAYRRPRSHPRWHAALGHLRPGLGMGRVGDHRSDLGFRRVVLRPALTVATRPDREPEPHLALVFPPRYPPRQPRPAPRR